MPLAPDRDINRFPVPDMGGFHKDPATWRSGWLADKSEIVINSETGNAFHDICPYW